jgi:hypothetical protein
MCFLVNNEQLILSYVNYLPTNDYTNVGQLLKIMTNSVHYNMAIYLITWWKREKKTKVVKKPLVVDITNNLMKEPQCDFFVDLLDLYLRLSSFVFNCLNVFNYQ